MFELTTLLIFALLGFYWHNQVTALDTCRKTGRHVTQQKGWVFLDDSLLQKSIRIKPRRGKLALVREFEFEFVFCKGPGRRPDCSTRHTLARRRRAVLLGTQKTKLWEKTKTSELHVRESGRVAV